NTRAVTFNADGSRVAVAIGTGAVAIWDVPTGNKLREMKGPTGHRPCITFSPDDRWVAAMAGTPGRRAEIKLWDAASGKESKVQMAQASPVWHMAFSPDSKLLATAGADRTVRVWEVATGLEVFTLVSHLDDVNAIAFHPGGKMLASASSDRAVKLWSLVD